VYICIALEPVILQLICTQNLVQVFHRYNISQVMHTAAYSRIVSLCAIADPSCMHSVKFGLKLV
jgi:hypothetical protein